MAFCQNCGAVMQDGARFCPSCGSNGGSVQGAAPAQPGYAQQPQYQQQHNSSGSAAGADAQDATNNKAMGILAYLGFLVLVTIFAAKESRFARYHANQGLVLAIFELAYIIVTSILNAVLWAISIQLAMVMSSILWLVSLVFVVLAVMGIVNAVNGRQKPLPVIGGITILK